MVEGIFINWIDNGEINHCYICLCIQILDIMVEGNWINNGEINHFTVIRLIMVR